MTVRGKLGDRSRFLFLIIGEWTSSSTEAAPCPWPTRLMRSTRHTITIYNTVISIKGGDKVVQPDFFPRGFRSLY